MFEEISIEHKGTKLVGRIFAPKDAQSWVIFAHGSGSSRMSPRNNWVANELNLRGHGTLLFDLLSPDEDRTYENRFNLPLLAERLELVTSWLLRSSYYHGQPIAYFGASTGAGAALLAAANQSENSPLFTVISRGGRPDLAGEEPLRKVSVPVLLIVGSMDDEVIRLNEMARSLLPQAEIKLVEGATHLFEEPGKLNSVVELTEDWLNKQLKAFHFEKTQDNFPKKNPQNFRFRNRTQAGIKLGERLLIRGFPDPVILALPRGGVTVAEEVARILGAPLDVVISRKIGAPGNEEYGIGAISEDEMPRFRADVSAQYDLGGMEVRDIIDNEVEEVRRRITYYRHGRELPEIKDRTVILVDDGLATGSTAVAAGAFLRSLQPKELIFAAPVCPQHIGQEVREQFDEIICLESPGNFQAVGLWYDDFRQVEDREVLLILERHHLNADIPPTFDRASI